ncbi:MAG: glucan biosynthesis protein [Puniceicoccales bacterium]
MPSGARKTSFRLWRFLGVGALCCLPASLSFSAGAERVTVDFAYVEEIAKSLAQKPYAPPAAIPESLQSIDYDQYRDIRFNPIKALWADEDLPFRIEFFHLGYLYRDSVIVNETTATHKQKIPYSSDLFDYGKNNDLATDLPSNLGYAGIRILYPLNDPNVFDEVAVFQGGSYFRMLSRGQVWGLSSRGLAINTGTPAGESFPLFREFWLRKPKPEDRELVLYALLDGKWATGAYEFTLLPGDPTTMKIRATLYFRQTPARVGLAPFSSMFWYGEVSLNRPSDYRPEVHDSDNLVIQSSSGEFLSRPLLNPKALSESFFEFDGVQGWGLLQRDRVYGNYEDIEAAYHRRPGSWVVPKSGFGSGSVYLLELPVSVETEDNIAAMWLPDPMPEPQVPYSFSYDLSTPTSNPSPNGWVQATRQGRALDGRHQIVIDWGGGNLPNLAASENIEVVLTTTPEDLVEEFTLEKNPYNDSWRLVLYLRDRTEEDSEGILRAFLRFNDQILTETWTLPWKP